ncbi:alkaline-phosphatase-like protein [Aspergillus avenaceus]|uniref:Alkaline-phosphatase-like protein n=1 Tax=Aspergillus avenaceus TaxID=36643 RepID=A0A5N6U4N2_ASPAV|nr:alkaline-phosphatase-like protein [Aspergillus avenaceus]
MRIPVLFLWVMLIHIAGLHFFTKGFLLSRWILESKSQCSFPPIETGHHCVQVGAPLLTDSVCWMPKSFDRAIILVIDALRYDFTIPSRHLTPTGKQTNKPFHDSLTVLFETTIRKPHNAMLFPFIADPPTTTLQRLKGLTTGTLPTFIEASSNFAGSALLEDNIVSQLRDAGKRLVHLGDDTWIKLFPDHFVGHLSHAYDSLLVEDLHTVDNGVIQHLYPLLHANDIEWDVIFAHFLGVDHVGHRYGPSHPEMAHKLRQMDSVIRTVMDSVDDNTLLIAMGDHGMDAHGNHGGESDDEVQAALWMYSRREFFGSSGGKPHSIARSTSEKSVLQIDLVPTLSLLLGIPIPFNNLGSPIEEAFIGPHGNDWRQLLSANVLGSAQIERFRVEYTGFQAGSKNLCQWLDTENNASAVTLYHTLHEHQRNILSSYKRVWTQFNTTDMLRGILLLLFTIGFLIVFLNYLDSHVCRSFISAPSALAIGLFMGVVLAWTDIGYREHINVFTNEDLVLGAIISFTVACLRFNDVVGLVRHGCRHLNANLWNYLAIAFIILLSFAFASNSYIVWEGDIVLNFLSTFAILALCASSHISVTQERLLATCISTLFLFLSRIASLTRYCREEQLPFCDTTFYPVRDIFDWRAFASFVIAIIIPRATKMMLKINGRPHTFLRLWFNICLPTALFLNTICGIIISTEEYEWHKRQNRIITAARKALAQSVLAISVLGVSFAFMPVLRRSPQLNVRYEAQLVFSMSILLVCLLVSNATGQVSLAILYTQLLSLRHLLRNSSGNYMIKSTIAALLGSLHFFATGHNATLSSIQWKAAYIPFQELHLLWSPILVIMNTFSGPIVAASILPLLVVPLPSHRQPSPGSTYMRPVVAKALVVHVLVYNVWALATAVWASILRRHLMLFAVFCPRFLMAAALLLIIDVIVSANLAILA